MKLQIFVAALLIAAPAFGEDFESERAICDKYRTPPTTRPTVGGSPYAGGPEMNKMCTDLNARIAAKIEADKQAQQTIDAPDDLAKLKSLAPN